MNSNVPRTHFASSLRKLYDWLDGTSSVKTKAGSKATATAAFAVNPVAGQTLTIGGTAVTFVANGAAGSQVNIGASLAVTLASLLALLNGSADAQISKASYGVAGSVLSGTAKAAGPAGNAITLATTTGAVLSGATFAGGGTNATAAAFGHYETSYATSGSGAAELVTVGTAPVTQVGRRKLFTLGSKGAAGDSVSFSDPASFGVAGKTVSAVVLSNVGDFVLAEWTGAKWQVVYAAAGVVTAA